MLQQLNELPIGKPEAIIADAGYFSELNVELCVEAGFIPCTVAKRDRHHWGLRHWKTPKEPGPRASALEKTKYRFRTAAGRAMYALRKQTVEPVFGNIKRAMHFNQFLLRGHEKAKGEWTLACIAWNIRHLHAMAMACEELRLSHLDFDRCLCTIGASDWGNSSGINTSTPTNS